MSGKPGLWAGVVDDGAAEIGIVGEYIRSQRRVVYLLPITVGAGESADYSGTGLSVAGVDV